jgi:hypothetical protein
MARPLWRGSYTDFDSTSDFQRNNDRLFGFRRILNLNFFNRNGAPRKGIRGGE